jgi:competence protein ComEC
MLYIGQHFVLFPEMPAKGAYSESYDDGEADEYLPAFKYPMCNVPMRQQRPLLIPFLAMAAGLTLADLGGYLLPFSILAAAFSCLLLSCLIRNGLPLFCSTAIFFFIWGMYALTPWNAPDTSPCSIRQMATRTPVVIEGMVCSRPVSTSEGCSFTVQIEGLVAEGRLIPFCGKLMLFVSTGDVELMRGDRIRCSTRIALPRRLGLPGEFDYARYLSYQGVSATGWVATPDAIVLVRAGAEESLLRRIDLVARRMGEFIRLSVSDPETSSVLTALLLGDQKRIPDQLNAAYTKAGVNHILSISGFHVGIIAYCIVLASLFLLTRSEFLALHLNLRRFSMLLAVPAMIAYLFLTGAAPATARSVIMLAAFVLALHAERESDPVNALLLAAFLLVAFNPPSLFDLSFQLSFLALWGIVIITPYAMERSKKLKHAWQRNLVQFLAASFAASFVTAVPVLFYFGQASLNGILSNFLIVPILGYGAVLCGFCALPLVYIFPPAAHLLLWCAGKLTMLSNWLVTQFAALPLLHFNGITRTDMLCFVAFMCVLTFVRRSRVSIALCTLFPSMAVILHLTAPSAADGRLHITMLSVGQGESLLLRLPDGSAMLVDGGGYLHENGRDFGRRTLGPALWKLGVSRIDRLVLTHSHPDHIGGMPFVAGNFPVGEFWEPVPGGVGECYDQLRGILSGQHVPRKLLGAGDELTLAGNVVLKVLSPRRNAVRKDLASDEMGINEESLVFRLSYGSFSMLFTADAGFSAEERILKDGTDLTSTVLKIGHHGSRYSTSETLLGRVAPEIALISAGRSNSFGLPSVQTLSLLNRHGILTYRTDRDGTIELVSDGHSWSVSTPYRPD